MKLKKEGNFALKILRMRVVTCTCVLSQLNHGV